MKITDLDLNINKLKNEIMALENVLNTAADSLDRSFNSLKNT